MIGVLLVALVLSSAPASRPSRPAAEAAEAALSHYEAGRFAEARAAIARAYMIEPWPEYLYARAQIERGAGDCVAAREFYGLYLEADPSARGAELARAGIELCPVPVPPPVPVGTDAKPTSAPPRVDRLGVALTATGGIGLLVGSGLYLGMAANRRAAEDASSHGSFGTHLDRARRLGVAAASVVSIGAVLAVAGVARLAIVQRRNRSTRRVARAPLAFLPRLVALGTGLIIRW